LAPVQAQERILRIAHKMFKEQKYISAQEAYLKVIKRNYRSAEVLKNLGDCYYFNGQQEEAVNWYKEFIESYPDQIAPEYYFKFAQCLKSIEDYSGSDQYMDRLLAVKSYDIRAKIFDKERDYLKRIEYQSGRYEIENSPINSSFTDFGTAYYGDNVVFSSSRDTLLFNKRIHKWNDEAFLQLYKANHDPETGLLFNLKTFAQELSTKFHESTPAFSNDGNTIYFTRNHKTDSKKELVRLKIYRSFKN